MGIPSVESDYLSQKRAKHHPTTMRGIFVLAMACLLAFATFAEADDECLGCADRIKAAVDYCNETDAVTIECVVDALGAAEECLKCICQIIDIVDNHPGLCK